MIRSRRFGFSAAQVERNCSSAPLLARPSVNLRREVGALVEADLPAGDRGPEPLLVLVEVLRVDPLPLALDDGEAPGDVRSDRDEPRHRRELAARAALLAAARRGRDARSLAVEVGGEQGVERDDALVVGRRLRDEVDDDARLLARVDAHDPADPLLVHAARGRRRQVHADGRAGRVPALGEELGVDEHVDLAALVRRERLGEASGRSASRDGLGLEPGRAELLREVVRVVDSGGVDDPGRRAEAVAVEAGGGLVQCLVVEGCGEGALLEVTADDRDRVDRGRRRDAHAAERRDQAAPGRVAEREVVDRGGEDVRDLLRDQLLRRGHADEERLVECADRPARLLAERRVRLVAEHEVVRLAVELRPVAREPGVGLDRDRVVARRALALEDRLGEPVAVALRGQVARELGDEQPAVREDEDAESARGFDESRGCDGLPGSGRVPEAVAAHGSRVGPMEGGLERGLVDEPRVEVVLRLLVELGIGDGAVALAVPVSVLLRRALRRRDQLCEHAREGVDLVTAELGPGRGANRILGQDTLEPQHEPVAHLPAGRRRGQPGGHLLERVAECRTAGGARCEGDLGLLARSQERLAGPRLRASSCRGQVLWCVRRQGRGSRCFVHARST